MVFCRHKSKKAVEVAYGNEKGKVSQEQYDLIAEQRRKDHEPSAIDPLNLQSYVENLRKALQTFVMEVDFVLNESNALTMIEV